MKRNPGNLKIKDAHYKTLKAALTKVATKHPQRKQWGGSMRGWLNFYKGKRLSEKRARWDLLWAATRDTLPPNFVVDTLYPYMNDDHIDSALRAIVVEMRGAPLRSKRHARSLARLKAKRNPGGLDPSWMTNAGLGRELRSMYRKIDYKAARKMIEGAFHRSHVPHVEGALMGRDAALITYEVARDRAGANKLFIAMFKAVGPKSNPRYKLAHPGQRAEKGEPVGRAIFQAATEDSIPVGRRDGEVFTEGGVRYKMISYRTKTGKRVRYARKV